MSLFGRHKAGMLRLVPKSRDWVLERILVGTDCATALPTSQEEKKARIFIISIVAHPLNHQPTPEYRLKAFCSPWLVHGRGRESCVLNQFRGSARSVETFLESPASRFALSRSIYGPTRAVPRLPRSRFWRSSAAERSGLRTPASTNL